MPHRKTKLLPGCCYHLYNRGNNHQNIFFERENYLYFLRQFRHYLVEETLDVLAYCLMPNHYHFLVCLRAENLSQRMQAFTLSYTKAMNRRYDRCGSLFQGRFQSIPVDTERYLLQLSYYIHLNPVKAGFVKYPEEWEFSSYLEYANLRQGTLPELGKIRQIVGTAQAYRAAIEVGSSLEPQLRRLLLD
ncbi:MAG: transposase [Cyanobacteria bacterium J06638_28]